MENVLLKLAQQIAAYDEASLSSLWDKYAELVEHFEPTKRWEEAVIVLGLIQAVRFKNQLFNHHWALSTAQPAETAKEKPSLEPTKGKAKSSGKGKLLNFKLKEE